MQRLTLSPLGRDLCSAASSAAAGVAPRRFESCSAWTSDSEEWTSKTPSLPIIMKSSDAQVQNSWISGSAMTFCSSRAGAQWELVRGSPSPPAPNLTCYATPHHVVCKYHVVLSLDPPTVAQTFKRFRHRDSTPGTQVAWVRAEYPNQLDYSGCCFQFDGNSSSQKPWLDVR